MNRFIPQERGIIEEDIFHRKLSWATRLISILGVTWINKIIVSGAPKIRVLPTKRAITPAQSVLFTLEESSGHFSLRTSRAKRRLWTARATEPWLPTEFFRPQLDELGLENMWFQQDVATAHTARATTNILKEAFPGRLISRLGDLHWPTRSPDLTDPDFFLWGILKSRVYVNKPQTLEALKENIRQEWENLSPEVLARVMENAIKRARMVINSGGGHLADIIFSTWWNKF